MNSEFMKRAIELAKKARFLGDVPVGAVVVKDGKIVGEGYNQREFGNNPIAHAECIAITEAARVLGDWRLNGCELYVTLEPCVMCTGAIINSRISTVIFGAYDLNGGCVDSVANLTNLPLGSKPEIFGGILEDECKKLLTDFFEEKRKQG